MIPEAIEALPNQTDQLQHHTPRPAPWQDVPAEKWNDWRWQLSHRLNTIEDFERIIRLTPDERKGLSAPGLFRVDVTPYFASLIDPDDPNCPIRRQVIPTGAELIPFDAEMADPLAEDEHSPVPGVVHRYPDRAGLMVTTQCASYCRFCTRSRVVGDPFLNFGRDDFDRGLAYIAATPQIRDVLLTGGDALVLAPRVLEDLLKRVRAIPHVEIIRMSTRVPIFLPQRINEELTSVIQKYHPVWMNINVNHPQEITPEAETALARLANAGVPLGSQSVLMAGINDCPNIIMALMHKLVKNRVRPYYLYQCDLVQGAGHFRTPVAKGIEVMEALRGHTSGYAVPTFVIDAPKGGGKVPLMPNYVLSMSDSRVVIRNFEGFISTYVQPRHYEAHDPSNCAYCQSQANGAGKDGVAGLLAEQGLVIKPEGWHDKNKTKTN